MKKKVYFYSLLMAIVMMVVSPGRAWADCLRVYDNDHDLLSEYTFVNDQVFVDLGVGQYIELVLLNNERAECNPTCNALITSDGIVDSDNDGTIDGLVFDLYGSRSLLVNHAGRYIVTLSNRSFDESEVKEDVWVENWVDEYTGDDADGNPTYTQMDNGYWENRTVGYSVITANATLTFREVPTFDSLEDLIAANQDYDAVNVTVDDVVAYAMPDPNIDNVFIVIVRLSDAIVGLISASPEPALNWESGGRVTGTLTNVKWDNLDHILSSETAFWSALNYTEPDLKNIPTYSSIADLLADQNLASGTNVNVTVSGTIAMAEYESEDNSYLIKLDNGFTIGAMGWVTSDPGWTVGGTISGTLQNVQFVRGEGEEGEETGAVFSSTKNIFAPGAGLEYTAPVVASVTIGETTTGYADIQDALTAAKTASSATLTLLQDVNIGEDASLTFDAGNVTLDLNGYTLEAFYRTIDVNGASLTITDTSDDGNGEVISTTSNALYISGGQLDIYGGTIISKRSVAFSISPSDNVTVSIRNSRFITESENDEIPAIMTFGLSALADGYAYYNPTTGQQLHEAYGVVCDENGNFAKDVIVKEAGEEPEEPEDPEIEVRGELVVGSNEIYIGGVTGEASDRQPKEFNIYQFTAPSDGTIIVSSMGDEDTYGVLYDASFNFLASNDDDGKDSNFSFAYEVTEVTVYYIGVRHYNGEEIGNYIINISMPMPLDEMTIVDGDVYDGSNAGRTVTSLTYQRTISDSQVGKWQALYVPFQLPIAKLNEKGFDVACINNFHEYTDEKGNVLDRELEIKMLTSGTLKSNWPYLIRPKTAGEKNIVLENAKLANDGTYAYGAYAYCSSVTTGYYFYGTYQPMTELYSNGYMFLSGGALQTAANDGQELKPMRWYLNISDNYGNQLADDDDDYNNGGNGGGDDDPVATIGIRVIGETDAATGIEDISIVTTVMDQQSVSEAIYDLQGRQLSTVGEGINIIRQSNGKVKKVMIIK